MSLNYTGKFWWVFPSLRFISEGRRQIDLNRAELHFDFLCLMRNFFFESKNSDRFSTD